MPSDSTTKNSRDCNRADEVGEFFEFLLHTRVALKTNIVSVRDSDVETIREPLEDHYLDDRGQKAMYQRLESALYDDSRELVTLWRIFDDVPDEKLLRYQSMLKLETDGLTGDRHPRKVFDRSPFGIAAIVIGTITLWMTFFNKFSGQDMSELMELVRFNWIAGSIWVGGLFIGLWYILKTLRNNRQVAFLGTLQRALTLYLGAEQTNASNLVTPKQESRTKTAA